MRFGFYVYWFLRITFSVSNMLTGGILNPKSVSGRTLIGFWWLYCIVVTATFTGQLMATLTVTSVKPPFNSIAEMVAQDGYKWGTASGGTVIYVSLQVHLHMRHFRFMS